MKEINISACLRACEKVEQLSDYQIFEKDCTPWSWYNSLED
jgi:hypothetical protein